MANSVNLEVRSTVIDWQTQTMEITDMVGGRHTVPLDKRIHVTMVGYPDREEQSMLARELGAFMSRGYIIERIDFEEEQSRQRRQGVNDLTGTRPVEPEE
jgi:hypothetical protein